MNKKTKLFEYSFQVSTDTGKVLATAKTTGRERAIKMIQEYYNIPPGAIRMLDKAPVK